RCFYIDKLETKEAFQSSEPKKEIAVIKNDEIIGDLLDAALYNLHKNDHDEPAKYLENHLVILYSAYEHYRILLKEFSEKKARKIAGLKNELLFRIAYYNNQLKK